MTPLARVFRHCISLSEARKKTLSAGVTLTVRAGPEDYIIAGVLQLWDYFAGPVPNFWLV